MANTFSSVLVIPWRPHTQLVGPTKPFLMVFYTNGLSCLMPPKTSQTSNIWPLHTLYFLLSGPGPVLVAISLGLQFGFSWETSSQGQVAAICTFLFSSCQVAPGRAQALADVAPPRRPQSQCTQWRASDQAGLQRYCFQE